MNLRQLKQQVQELGKMRTRISGLEGSERQLSESVRQALISAKRTQAESADYVAQLAEQRKLQLDPRKFRRKAGEKLFMKCARIDLKTARLHFPNDGLDRLGEVKVSVQLRVSKRPKG